MKRRRWKNIGWMTSLCSGIILIFFAVINIVKNNKGDNNREFVAICLGIYFLWEGVRAYKEKDKPNENILSDKELEDMKNELIELIKNGEKIKAIKRHRMITSLGLKEAKEYVDLLCEEI